MTKRLKIGEVAQRCEVSTDTLRYYEKRGLIEEPERFESSGYRAFSPEVIERIAFIDRAQQLGFTLGEIKELLALRADDEASCAEIRELAESKARQIRQQITELREILEGLEDLAELCPGDVPAGRCPLVEILGANGEIG